MSASIPAPKPTVYQTARISLHDEAELVWYFCHGEAEFQRSVHGAMTERLERDSMGSNRCSCCKGSGIIDTAKALGAHLRKAKGSDWSDRRERERGMRRGPRLGEVVVSRTGGSIVRELEVALQRPGDPIWTTEVITRCETLGFGQDCWFCHGTGWVPAKKFKPRCRCWGMGPFERARCPQCLGTGTPTLTARPQYQKPESSGNEVDGDTLKRFAAISRRMTRIRIAHREVLRIYHGPEGQSWADTPMGRLLGLEVHTPAGRDLLEQTHVEGDEATGASPAERIADQDALEKTKPHRWRRLLLEAAAGQAEAMVRVAHLDWLASAHLGRWRDQLAELEEEIHETGCGWERWLDEHWTSGVDVEEGAAQ